MGGTQDFNMATTKITLVQLDKKLWGPHEDFCTGVSYKSFELECNFIMPFLLHGKLYVSVFDA